MNGTFRPWAAIAAGLLLVAALTAYARGARPIDPPPTADGDTVTYEVTGPERIDSISYGDIFDLIYSPYVATTIEQPGLPWSLRMPYRAPLSMHDLGARSDDPAKPRLTCTVRFNGVVVSSNTGPGEVGCDTTPAAG